jgi:hypothetical protein
MPPLTPANDLIRSRNVTASEVGALLGAHPYVTAGEVWDRLNGLRDGFSGPSLAMRFGSEAEPILRRLAIDSLGVRVKMNSRTWEHSRVRLCATPDAFIIREPSNPFAPGNVPSLLEFKLTFSQYRWQHGLPPDIEWQARAQMACTHRSRVIVYVFSGKEHVYVVDRHKGKERAMTQAVERFWNEHMLTGIRPPDPVPAEVVV